jgi:DNA invertase Pin-like site-specific DNA recombinase
MAENDNPANRPPVIRALTYNRVSTGKQQERQLSIPDQIAQNRAYCEERGYTIIEEVVEAKSGTTMDARPEIQRVLSMGLAKPPAFDVLVCHSTSRWARSQTEGEYFRFRLKKNGVRIESVTQQFEDTAIGEMTRKIMGMCDEINSSEIAKHVKRSMLAGARNGYFMGAIPPYGYQIDIVGIAGDRRHRKLAKHPEEAEVVKLIFKLAMQGDGNSGRMGIKKIVNYLRENGYKTRKGRNFYTSEVNNILVHECYTGTYWFNRWDSRAKLERPRGEWVGISIPEIISPEDFQQVQLELRENAPTKRAPRIAASQVLLSGLVRCGVCGGNMLMCTGTSASGTVHRYYKCAKRKNQGLCDPAKRTTIREEELDAIVISSIAENLLTAQRVEEIVRLVSRRREASQDSATQNLARLRKELKAVEKYISNMLDVVAKGVVQDDEMFSDKYRALGEQRASLVRLIESAERLMAEQIKPLDRVSAEQAAQVLKSRIQSAPKHQQKRLVRAIVGEVTVAPDEITIVGLEDCLAETAMAASLPDFPLRNAVRVSEREWLASQSEANWSRGASCSAT